MTGREREDAVDRRQWLGHGSEGQVARDPGGRELPLDQPGREQRFHLRGEEHARVLLSVVERLDPERIPAQQQPVLARVPDRKREHPAKAPHAVVAPAPVGLEDHLGVAARGKRHALADQLLPELREVVDHPVERDRRTALGSCIGWWPSGEGSMIARRRDASPTLKPGASKTSRPSSSGPRWTIWRLIASSGPRGSRSRAQRPANPQIRRPPVQTRPPARHAARHSGGLRGARRRRRPAPDPPSARPPE